MMESLVWLGVAVFFATNVAFFAVVWRRWRDGGGAAVQAHANTKSNVPFILGWLLSIGLMLAGARR